MCFKKLACYFVFVSVAKALEFFQFKDMPCLRRAPPPHPHYRVPFWGKARYPSHARNRPMLKLVLLHLLKEAIATAHFKVMPWGDHPEALAPALYPRTLHLVSQVKYMAPRRSTGSISLGKAHKESDETFYLIGLRTLTTYFSALFCFISA